LASPFVKKPVVEIKGPGSKSLSTGKVKVKITALPAKEGVNLRGLHWWVDGRPLGPAVSAKELEGTEVTFKIGERALKAVFRADAGIDGLVAQWAEAVEKDEALKKPEGVRAVANGGVLFLEARKEGTEANGKKFSAEISLPADRKEGAATLKADPTEGELSGGAETKVVPAHLEITLNAKKAKLAKGDSLTLTCGRERFTATVTDKDLASGDPLVAFVKQILEPMKTKSKVFGEPQARKIRTPATRVTLTLNSAKPADEGNGTEVTIAFTKEKGSALSISPKGTRKMEGGGTWKFHAKARVDFYAVFGPLKDREEVLDTTRLGDGFHRLMLVAEEDTEIAAQGCAMMEIKVANCKGRLRLNKPRRLNLAQPIPFSARFYGTYPGGSKRMVLLVDGREVGEFSRARKFLLDRAKIPLGAGKHAFQVHVEPKKDGMPALTSEPIILEFPREQKEKKEEKGKKKK
jgi:hypothetical protein